MTSPSRTLLHVFPSFAVGGAQMRLVQIANHFGRTYRHAIISLNGDTAAYAHLSPDLDVRLITVPVQAGKTWANLPVFRRVLRTLRPDLLITSNWGSIEWALANTGSGCAHLHMEDGFGPEESDHQLPRRVWTRRLALRRSTVTVPSRLLQTIARSVWRLPERRLTLIPNGVDCRRFGGAADLGLAHRLGLSDAVPIIGTVAALRAEKNVGRLLESFATIARQRPARLVIVGDGPQRRALEGQAAALGIADSVTFTGACAAPEKLLPLFDVFALSSDTEQMPLSVLEAMAAGRPVAATDVGDVATMVSAANRPYVVAKDVAALAGALQALLDQPSLARQIGAANQQRARVSYDQSQMFAAYRRLFDGASA